ncbi:SDR family oxidoreductase [Nocardia halotolerans]|uniref:SDR family oxidoreductase n=1 Tax=Nocardia halotolerans TaxID=1755878 RepID=A0ABV8VE50_9NOCA
MEILVCGATGHIGRHLVEQLLDDGHQVRALSRDPHAAKLPPGALGVRGDLTDVATLEAAFSGVDAVHLITFGGDDGADLTNGRDIVGLAQRCGIGRATVLGGWSTTSVEAALRRSDLAWTRLEPVEIMYNTFDWLDEIEQHRTVSSLADWPSAMVHEADIAAVARCALTQHGHAGKSYRLTGPEALTPAQRTQLLAAAIGEPLTHRQLTEAQERTRLAGHGFGDDYVEFGLRLAKHPPAAAAAVLDTVPKVTGHAARTFGRWATEHAHLFT